MLKRKNAIRRDTAGAKAWARKPRKALAVKSKKQRGRDSAMDKIKDKYFKKFHHCQVCAEDLDRAGANGHHKKLRSAAAEQRHEDREAAANLLIAHEFCHLKFLHDGVMGVPVNAEGRERLEKARTDPANAANGYVINWTAQQRLDLWHLKQRQG